MIRLAPPGRMDRKLHAVMYCVTARTFHLIRLEESAGSFLLGASVASSSSMESW